MTYILAKVFSRCPALKSGKFCEKDGDETLRSTLIWSMPCSTASFISSSVEYWSYSFLTGPSRTSMRWCETAPHFCNDMIIGGVDGVKVTSQMLFDSKLISEVDDIYENHCQSTAKYVSSAKTKLVALNEINI